MPKAGDWGGRRGAGTVSLDAAAATSPARSWRGRRGPGAKQRDWPADHPERSPRRSWKAGQTSDRFSASLCRASGPGPVSTMEALARSSRPPDGAAPKETLVDGAERGGHAGLRCPDALEGPRTQSVTKSAGPTIQTLRTV